MQPAFAMPCIGVRNTTLAGMSEFGQTTLPAAAAHNALVCFVRDVWGRNEKKEIRDLVAARQLESFG